MGPVFGENRTCGFPAGEVAVVEGEKQDAARPERLWIAVLGLDLSDCTVDFQEVAVPLLVFTEPRMPLADTYSANLPIGAAFEANVLDPALLGAANAGGTTSACATRTM